MPAFDIHKAVKALHHAGFDCAQDLEKQNKTRLRYALGMVALTVALIKVPDAIIG